MFKTICSAGPRSVVEEPTDWGACMQKVGTSTKVVLVECCSKGFCFIVFLEVLIVFIFLSLYLRRYEIMACPIGGSLQARNLWRRDPQIEEFVGTRFAQVLRWC